MAAIPRLKPHVGPMFLSYGFRPFFFFGACYAALAMALWIPQFQGVMQLPTLFGPRDWHVHEMLYGYVAAVITGFLLTAIPNWTGRLPLQGMPLVVLVLAWAAGRIAVNFSTALGSAAVAVIDVAFLVLVVAAAGREILAGQNWRNLKVLIPVGILACANAGFHVEAILFGAADYSLRLGVAAILILIMLIGGRIVPSFTRNWLVRENPGRLPTPFDKFDGTTLALSACALLIWSIEPRGSIPGIALLVAAILQAARLGRWAGDRTSAERLLFILHVAYAFVPLGFLLTSLAAFDLIQTSAGLHAWLAGGVGAMTLAVMTRASLGHTGRELKAGWGIQAIYFAVVFAALARVAAGFLPSWHLLPSQLAAICWIAAFAGFAILFGPVLFGPRRAGEAVAV